MGYMPRQTSRRANQLSSGGGDWGRDKRRPCVRCHFSTSGPKGGNTSTAKLGTRSREEMSERRSVDRRRRRRAQALKQRHRRRSAKWAAHDRATGVRSTTARRTICARAMRPPPQTARHLSLRPTARPPLVATHVPRVATSATCCVSSRHNAQCNARSERGLHLAACVKRRQTFGQTCASHLNLGVHPCRALKLLLHPHVPRPAYP